MDEQMNSPVFRTHSLTSTDFAFGYYLTERSAQDKRMRNSERAIIEYQLEEL